MNFKNCILVFLRHGETNRDENDFLRELTPSGINQAITFREAHEDFDIFICSPAMRSVQTAQIMIGAQNKEIIKLDDLYSLPDPEENKILIDILKRVGNVSLKDYYQIEKGENFDLLIKIGVEGANKLEGSILRYVHDQKILVVGHSVTIQSLIYSVFPTSGLARDIALESVLMNCEAVKIVTDKEGKVTSARIIS